MECHLYTITDKNKLISYTKLNKNMNYLFCIIIIELYIEFHTHNVYLGDNLQAHTVQLDS